jgi:hypothetical protein
VWCGQLSFAKTIEGIAALRDELDERVTAMRCISNEKKRMEIAAHQIDFFMRRMVQVGAGSEVAFCHVVTAFDWCGQWVSGSGPRNACEACIFVSLAVELFHQLAMCAPPASQMLNPFIPKPLPTGELPTTDDDAPWKLNLPQVRTLAWAQDKRSCRSCPCVCPLGPRIPLSLPPPPFPASPLRPPAYPSPFSCPLHLLPSHLLPAAGDD